MSEKTVDEIAEAAFEELVEKQQLNLVMPYYAKRWFVHGFKAAQKPHTKSFGCINGKYHKYKVTMKDKPSTHCLRCGEPRKVY